MGDTRCPWAKTNPLLTAYHDTEWGVPIHDDRQLFEMLNLEGAQAGLSWQTILARRENYRHAFDNFDAEKIMQYDDAKRATLLQDEGIIRNRLKVNAFIENAKATLAMQQKHGSLDKYLWNFIGDKHLTQADHDEATEISKLMSKQLKKDGFRFVGPTTCYAFMQAVGMMNDHVLECFRYSQMKEAVQYIQGHDEPIELQNELDTFLKAYEQAANSRDFSQVAPFIADDATFWFTNGQFNGKAAIQKAFEDTWANIQNEAYTISNVQWAARTPLVAVCIYAFKSDGIVDGKRQVYEGHGTNVIRCIAGRWRVVHEHLSK